ncbi:MAG: MupG family TIM beta-alpha barrel fold protein [Eubacteriales bacterium]|nr:MupG family TIM beta-alpha barrel fold protein [Eubacteriales bacterium]
MTNENWRRSLSFSCFLHDFENQKALLAKASKAAQQELLIFTSLHVYEEISPSYRKDVEAMCRWLNEHGFKIIADVSARSKDYFECPDLTVLAEELALWALRPDYGFGPEEIQYFSQKLPLVVNATTTAAERIAELASEGKEVYAMHNYYPRPETALDPAFFNTLNREIKAREIAVMAFIPGDIRAAKPLGLGLPTLEHQRDIPPSVAYAEMLVKYDVDQVFVGDPGLSLAELKRIQDYSATAILSIPARLTEAYHDLYGRVFTHRLDSPSSLIRFAESREYAVQGARTEVGKTLPRPRGSITIDNERYMRYSGEIQMLREDLPADSRVNLIGSVEPAYLDLVDCVPRGTQFKLVEA